MKKADCVRRTGLVKSPAFLVLAAAFILALAGSPARAGEGDSEYFNYYKIELEGTRRDRVLTDLNGDGLKDLGMVYSRSDVRDTYWFRACLQEKGKGFSEDCSQVKMPSEARAFAVGEIDGKPGAELFIVTDRGAGMASFSASGFGSFKKLEGVTTILRGTEADRPVLLRCLWDIDNDSRLEIILPSIDGPVIYRYGESGLELLQKINSPAFITYRVGSLGDIMATDDVNQFLLFRKYEKRTTANYTAPDVFVEDFDGDGRKDVITLVDNTLRVFPGGPEGRFPEKPSLAIKRSILPPEERDVGFAGEAMTFADLNGDGRGDIIMMKWGTSEERTQMDRYIYYARPGLKYGEEPDQIIRSESAAIDFGIYDLNNDDRLDLIIPFFHFAPAQAFKVLTENSIKIQFRIFLMKPDGKYSQDEGKTFAKVDRRVLLNYKIDVLGMIFDIRTLLEGNFRALITFGQDFNGDGYGDLVADTGGDKLEFYWGNAEADYARNPDHVIDYESAMDFDLADLNNDGKTDIITYYESEERTQKKRELVKKARSQGEPVSEIAEEAAIKAAPEGTRVKILLSK